MQKRHGEVFGLRRVLRKKYPSFERVDWSPFQIAPISNLWLFVCPWLNETIWRNDVWNHFWLESSYMRHHDLSCFVCCSINYGFIWDGFALPLASWILDPFAAVPAWAPWSEQAISGQVCAGIQIGKWNQDIIALVSVCFSESRWSITSHPTTVSL